MTAEIKLPGSPKDPAVFDPGRFGVAYSFSQLQAYARAAVELNRVVVDEAMVERSLRAYYDEGDEPLKNSKLRDMMRAALTAALGKEE